MITEQKNSTHLKLSHLNFLRSHVAQLVERLDSHSFAIMLVHPLKIGKVSLNFSKISLPEKQLL